MNRNIDLYVDNDFTKEEVDEIKKKFKNIGADDDIMDFLDEYKWLLWDEPATIYLFKKDKMFNYICTCEVG